jgi:beta-galactosidase
VWTSGVEASLAAGVSETFSICPAVFENPRLWEPDYPHVYRVVISLGEGGRIVDSTEIPFGLRHARWDPAAGLFLNGRQVKLHGWGQKSTNEWPGLGAAQPAWLHEFTLAMMRDAGGNIVRWGHTAGSPVQIAAGDRLGLIAIQPGVDGEGDTVRSAWQLRSEAFRDVVVYFRNSPSILIWEGGNQKLPREKAAELRGHMDKWDPHGGRAYAHRRADQVTAEFMDVGIGTEGGREIARLAVVEGEYNREESPRRVWDDASPPNFGYPEAKGQTYQLTSEQFAANQVAHYVKKLGAPEHAGGANWIFSDSTSGGRVSVEVARASGEVDGVRLPKEAYHAVATLFHNEPGVHIIGHWTYPVGTRKNVFVVSNAEEVELLINGRSFGNGAVSDKYLFTFRDVAWEPGEIRAVARSGGAVVAKQTKRTTGAAVALRITPIVGPGGFVADGSDVSLFDVEAVDADGARVPTFQERVDFELEGPAVWRGGYNSGKLDSTNHTWLDLEAGVNRVAVRATREPGRATLRARAEGLAAAEAEIEANAFAAAGGVSTMMPAVQPVRLSAEQPEKVVFSSAATTEVAAGGASPMAGRFTRTFNYSGPSSYIVHVEAFARAGKNAYVDVDSPLGELPPELAGADWVQAANREAFYHAVDLMELGVAEGAKVFVAHDDAVALPPWLTSQFHATPESFTVLGRRMTIFARSTAGGSLTLGPNTEDSTVREGNMYLVFVQGAVK